MKIISQRILNESIIDQLIKSDQKQDSILNFLPHTINKVKNNNVTEPVNKTISGKYNITFILKKYEVNGIYDLYVNKQHDIISLKNNKETIAIKFNKIFDKLDDLLNNDIQLIYIKGINYDLKNVNIKFTKIEKLNK